MFLPLYSCSPLYCNRIENCLKFSIKVARHFPIQLGKYGLQKFTSNEYHASLAIGLWYVNELSAGMQAFLTCFIHFLIFCCCCCCSRTSIWQKCCKNWGTWKAKRIESCSLSMWHFIWDFGDWASGNSAVTRLKQWPALVLR